MGPISLPPWPLNHNLLATKAFNTSFNLSSLHWHSAAKGKGKKNNLGTSSIFHEFSFRPKPPVTVVDRSSCCHIFNTWSYSCSPWGLPLTPAGSEAAPASTGTPRSFPCSHWCPQLKSQPCSLLQMRFLIFPMGNSTSKLRSPRPVHCEKSALLFCNFWC